MGHREIAPVTRASAGKPGRHDHPTRLLSQKFRKNARGAGKALMQREAAANLGDDGIRQFRGIHGEGARGFLERGELAGD